MEEHSLGKEGVEELVESLAMRTGGAEVAMGELESESWGWSREKKCGDQSSRSKKIAQEQDGSLRSSPSVPEAQGS